MVTTKRRAGFIVWKPRSFTGLMSLYEGNYLRMKRLLGGILPEPGERLVSRSGEDLDLHVVGVERTPYTTLVRLTYHWHEDGGVNEAPGLSVRLYHDAHLAEVQDRDTHPERRWARNHLLEKWLDYCHLRGHRFGPVDLTLVDLPQTGLR